MRLAPLAVVAGPGGLFGRPGLFLALRPRPPGLCPDSRLGAHPAFDAGGDLRVVAQELLGVLPPLADALAVATEPGARLLDHIGLDAEVDELADLGDAFAIHDVELDLAERRRHLVLHHLHAGL